MGAFSSIRNVVIGLVFLSMLGAVGAIAVASFRDGLTNAQQCSLTAGPNSELITYNSTSGLCTNVTNGVNGAPTYAVNISTDGLTGMSNASNFYGTIGTLVGVGALLAVVVGSFLLLRR